MLYYNRKKLIIEGKVNTIFTLRDITISEIQKKRLNQERFFILKDYDNLYTINEPLDDKNYFLLNNFLNFNTTSLCNMCNINTCLHCPKILDKPLRFSTSKKITQKKYISSKRIEKYRFIRCGFETNEKFCVWMCKYFNISEKNDDKDI